MGEGSFNMAKTAAKQKFAYIFFNCDGEKSEQSMNVFYNNTIYNQTGKGRKALLAKIQDEVAAGRVQVSDEDAVKAAVLKGEPTAANEFLTFGNIAEFEIC